MIQVPEQASLHGFSTNTHTVQQILEEAARSLKLLWRVSLPLKAAHGTAQGTQVLLGFIWALLVWLGWFFGLWECLKEDAPITDVSFGKIFGKP